MTSSIVRRFVTDGLRATLDSYGRSELPLSRFCWELHARLAALDPLLGDHERRSLAEALRALRAALDRLDPTGEPAGPVRPGNASVKPLLDRIYRATGGSRR
jgi:hypothetical protein